MKTRIQTIHFDADKKLLDFVNDKIDKLFKIYNSIESCDAILKLDKNKNKEVEINLNIPGIRLFSKSQSDKFEMAAEIAIDDIKKQLNTHKSKSADKNAFGLEILQLLF